MQLGEPDASGRRSPVETGETFSLEVEMVIKAAGQMPFEELIMDNEIMNNKGRIIIDNCATNIKGIFAGGDAVNGGKEVVDAVQAGKEGGASNSKLSWLMKCINLRSNTTVLRLLLFFFIGTFASCFSHKEVFHQTLADGTIVTGSRMFSHKKENKYFVVSGKNEKEKIHTEFFINRFSCDTIIKKIFKKKNG